MIKLVELSKDNGSGIDSAGRVWKTTYQGVGVDLVLEYDQAGNLVKRWTENGLSIFGYDSLNRLVQAQYDDGRYVTYLHDKGGPEPVRRC